MMEENCILEIVDKGIVKEENIDGIVMEVVKIVKMCVMVKEEERLIMKEVLMKLDSVLMGLKYKCGISDLNVGES